jgi:tRNA dimethylallyltransferase
MELARAHPGTTAILCLDAMQVHRGAEIGTGKPSAAERAEIPHGGLDLVEFGAPFDVGKYLAHAAEFLRGQSEAGRRVIVVGGTGLYFRALTRGLCEAPQGPEELRAELAALSVEDLRARLERVDAGMLARLDAKNPRRLARAIEVMEGTGKSLREWQDETPEPLVKTYTAVWLQREKEDLEARIEARVGEMLAAGWVEEVRGLVEKHGIDKVRAFPGIGYREIAEALSGTYGTDGKAKSHTSHWSHESHQSSETALRRDIFMATRRYAKRQLTWFAREPTLHPVMLTGHPSLSAAFRAAALPALS